MIPIFNMALMPFLSVGSPLIRQTQWTPGTQKWETERLGITLAIFVFLSTTEFSFILFPIHLEVSQ